MACREGKCPYYEPYVEYSYDGCTFGVSPSAQECERGCFLAMGRKLKSVGIFDIYSVTENNQIIYNIYFYDVLVETFTNLQQAQSWCRTNS